MRTTTALVCIVALIGTAAITLALEGLDDTETSVLFTGSDVRSAIGWTDLSVFQLGAPWGNGGEVGADADGNVYFLVGGYAPSEEPMRTGLVRYDGSGFTLLAEYEDAPGSEAHTGKLLRKVAVSPASSGLLAAGDPVVLLHRTVEVDGELEYSVDLVGVDPATGTETLLHRFGTGAADASVAIDADGTIYVGPLDDGSIDVLSFSAGSYEAAAISTDLSAACGLVVDADGALYTFEQGTSWDATGVDREIVRLDPWTGETSRHGWIDGDVTLFDWTWSGGKLWVGCRGPAPKGKQVWKRFVAEAPSGGSAGVETAITQSAQNPLSLSASGGDLLVLEAPTSLDDNAVHEVTPGTGSDGGGKPPKRK